MSEVIWLAANNGVPIEVDRQTATCSQVIKNMLEDLSPEDFEASAIPLPSVDEPVLRKVIAWCEQHKNDPEEAEDDDPNVRKRTDDISEWDKTFMDVDQELLFSIIQAANYLEIKPLITLGCKTIANMIKGKSPEEIRMIFNIPNDFTQDEEEQIRRENEWTEPDSRV